MKLLEPKFKKGTLIYTDNASFPSAKPFLNYLKSNPENIRQGESMKPKAALN